MSFCLLCRVRRTIRKQERKRQSSPYHLRCPMTSAERQSLHLTTEEAIDLKCLEKEVLLLIVVLDNSLSVSVSLSFFLSVSLSLSVCLSLSLFS